MLPSWGEKGRFPPTHLTPRCPRTLQSWQKIGLQTRTLSDPTGEASEAIFPIHPYIRLSVSFCLPTYLSTFLPFFLCFCLPTARSRFLTCFFAFSQRTGGSGQLGFTQGRQVCWCSLLLVLVSELSFPGWSLLLCSASNSLLQMRGSLKNEGTEDRRGMWGNQIV